MAVAVGDQVRVVGVWHHVKTGKIVRIEESCDFPYYILSEGQAYIFKAEELELIPPVLAEAPAMSDQTRQLLDEVDANVAALRREIFRMERELALLRNVDMAAREMRGFVGLSADESLTVYALWTALSQLDAWCKEQT